MHTKLVQGTQNALKLIVDYEAKLNHCYSQYIDACIKVADIHAYLYGESKQLYCSGQFQLRPHNVITSLFYAKTNVIYRFYTTYLSIG